MENLVTNQLQMWQGTANENAAGVRRIVIVLFSAEGIMPNRACLVSFHL